jgi:hypothetical protein
MYEISKQIQIKAKINNSSISNNKTAKNSKKIDKI